MCAMTNLMHGKLTIYISNCSANPLLFLSACKSPLLAPQSQED